jgi:hypothetical protein
MIFLKDAQGELYGLVKREVPERDLIRYKDRVGQERILFTWDNPTKVEFDENELWLISWETDDVPDLNELDQVVRDGARNFWYVEFGTDMVNMVCAPDEELAEYSQESRNLVGRSLFEALTS